MAHPLRIGFLLAKNEIDVQWHQPLSFGYLKAYLHQFLEDPVEMHFLEKREDCDSFDIIGISSTSQDFSHAQDIARYVKETYGDILTIIGGHHITYLPETLPDEFDMGVMGEGEEIFLNLIRCLSKKGLRPRSDDLKTIPGIVFREHGKIAVTPRQALIDPLDQLPFPYRSKENLPYLFSSRGCPYKCTFCSSSSFWKRTRFFSAEYVVKEIELILESFPETKTISVWDDLFIADVPRFKRIVKYLEETGINKKVSFTFSVRANLVNDELCNDMKQMNVTGVGFGAESGSNRILKLLDKGTTVETNQKAIDTLLKHDIHVDCSFIVGVPTETEEDVRRTYKFILKNMADGKLSSRSVVNILTPMPGTNMWDDAVKSGLIDLRQMDWKRLSIFASYKDSMIRNFDEWVKYRKKNHSIYLAEQTLPQERLYELMSFYEHKIKHLEGRQTSEKKQTSLLERLSRNLNHPFRPKVGR